MRSGIGTTSLSVLLYERRASNARLYRFGEYMPQTLLAMERSGVFLEGVLQTPDAGGPFATVVICHPHPLYGGSMGNNVVSAASAGVRAHGLATVLFNFRGVGRSSGEAGDRDEALHDVRAVLDYVANKEVVDSDRIGLAGYSFGSAVAADAATSLIPALALIALPLSMMEEDGGALATYPGPVLLLSGGEDGGSNAEGLDKLATKMTGATRVEIEAGADHFWSGHEQAVSDVVGEYFAKELGG